MNDPELTRIGTWSLPSRLIVILSACLLLTGIAYVTLLHTQQQQLTQVQNRYHHLRSTFEQQHARTAQLPRQQVSYTALRHALDQQVQPDTAPTSTADLLIAVSQIGLGTDVNFVAFQPQPGITHDLYIETPVTLSVTGHYHSLASFISNLARHPGIMTLHDIVLQRADPTSRKHPPLSLNFTLKAYQPTTRQTSSRAILSPLPVLPEIPPVIYAAAGRRDPFTPPKSTRPVRQPAKSQGVLQQYALNTLDMVGTINAQQQQRGLLQSPDGLIHQVRIGSYVGRHQGRVQAIHPDRIIVDEHQDADRKVHHITLRQTTPKTNETPSGP